MTRSSPAPQARHEHVRTDLSKTSYTFALDGHQQYLHQVDRNQQKKVHLSEFAAVLHEVVVLPSCIHTQQANHPHPTHAEEVAWWHLPHVFQKEQRQIIRLELN